MQRIRTSHLQIVGKICIHYASQDGSIHIQSGHGFMRLYRHYNNTLVIELYSTVESSVIYTHHQNLLIYIFLGSSHIAQARNHFKAFLLVEIFKLPIGVLKNELYINAKISLQDRTLIKDSAFLTLIHLPTLQYSVVTFHGLFAH